MSTDDVAAAIRKAIHELHAQGSEGSADAVWDLWDAYRWNLAKQDAWRTAATLQTETGPAPAVEEPEPAVVLCGECREFGSCPQHCGPCRTIQRVQRHWSARCPDHLDRSEDGSR